MTHLREVEAAERARAAAGGGVYGGGYAFADKAPVLVFDKPLFDERIAGLSLLEAHQRAEQMQAAARADMRHMDFLRGQLSRLKDELKHYRFGPDSPPAEGQSLITVPIGGNDNATVAYWPDDREFAAVWTAWGWLLAESLSDDKRDDFQSRLEVVL